MQNLLKNFQKVSAENIEEHIKNAKGNTAELEQLEERRKDYDTYAQNLQKQIDEFDAQPLTADQK